MKKIFTMSSALILTVAMNAQQVAKMPKPELVKTDIPSVVYTGELSAEGYAADAVPFKAPAATERDTTLEGQYFIDGQMYMSGKPGYISGICCLITPFKDTTIYKSVYGPGDWVYINQNDETVREENLAILNYPSPSYSWSYNNPTLSVYDCKIDSGNVVYNATFTDYMYGYAAEAYWPGQIAPTHMMNGYWEPQQMTNCEMMNADRSGEKDNAGNRYMVSSGAAGTSWCFGSGMTISSWGAGTLDTLVNIIPIPEGASMWCDTVFVHCYNRDATDIAQIFPATTNLTLTIYPIEIEVDPSSGEKVQRFRHDSIMAQATATQKECVEDGGGYSIQFVFKEKNVFGNLDVKPATLGQYCYAELTGFNESKCNFGIYCDYWETPTGGRTLWKKDGKYHSFNDMNIDMAFNAYYTDLHYFTDTRIEDVPAEGGVLQMSFKDDKDQWVTTDTLKFACNISTDFEAEADLYDAEGNVIIPKKSDLIADYDIISGPYIYEEGGNENISLTATVTIEIKPNLTGKYREETIYLKAYGAKLPIVIKQASALVPTVQDLVTAGYDVTHARVICLYFDEEVCNDIVWAGSYNEWATDPVSMLTFEPLENYPGWYVVEVVDESEVVMGKPVQLKKDGSFSWDFQSGDVDAWINMAQPGSKTAEINAGYPGEADATWPENGVYIYELAYFKNHNTPCAAPTPGPTVKTCAEAAAIALALQENNVPTEEVYSITGYVTNVVSAVSKGQQTFWMDDEKGDKKTFESYYCNLPADDQNTLNVGDQVKIVGKIMKYNTTPEMKNGDITIIERVTVKRDTFTVTTCEAYDECTSLDDGDASVDVFIVKDAVASIDDANENYGWQNITFKCDDNKLLVGYHIDFGGKNNFCAVGNTVEIIGNLKKYGEKMRIEGKGKVVAKRSAIVGDQFLDETIGLKFEVTSIAPNTVKVISNYYTNPSYTIPATVSYDGKTFSVTTIGGYAFYNCSGLTSVTIGNSVTTIGEYAFYGCSSLISVTIPNSATTIGEYAFAGCSGLTSITIPNSVTTILNYAFGKCTSLISIDVDAANTHYCSIDGVLFNYAKDTLIQYPAANTQTEYAIPNSVTTIGSAAFYNCSDLTSVTIGNSVTTIGVYAFYGCSSLISVTIPNSVTTIGEYAFYDCSGLTSITIPNSVTTIGNYAFARCSALADIYSYAINPPIAFDYTFYKVSKHCYIHVPAGAVRSYQLANGWSDFYHIIEISALPDGTTEVGVTVSNNYATFSWPVNPTASSYTLEITKDGELFCTLIFNSLGQLVGMAFAPGLGHNAPAATSTSYGYSFVVTGLTDNTIYAYTFSVKNENDDIIETKSGIFKTTGGGTPTSVDEVHGSQPTPKGLMHKVLRNGQLLIEANDATYTPMGQKVK